MDELIRLVEQAEGDIAALSADELATLRQGLIDGYDETRPNVSSRDELAALQRVQTAIAAVDARTAELASEDEALAVELAALDEQVHPPEPEAAAEGDPDPDGDGGEGDDPPADPPAGGDDDEDEEDDEPPVTETAETAPVPVAASAAPRLPSLSALRRQQRPESQPRPDADRAAGSRVLAFAGLQSIAADNEFPDAESIGRELASLSSAVQVGSPTGRRHMVGKILTPGETDTSRLIVAENHKDLDGEGLINLAVARNRERRLAAATIQASGGVCIPPTPDYRIDVVGDRGTPFVETLPTIVSNRPLEYFPWLEFDINSAPLADGIGWVTAAQDLAGYGGTHPLTGDTIAVPSGGASYKDCVKIDCPESQTCTYEEVYRCVTVGRFIANSWPEYVRVFDEWTGIYFDVSRDERAMGKVLAAAKEITAGPATFGATRDLLGRIRQLAAHIRSARHAPNLAINVYLPWFASYFLANDIAYSFAAGTENLRITPSQVLGLIAATEGIMIDTYNISAGTTADGSPTVLPLPADGAPLPDWPSQVRVLAVADGAVFHQAAGETSFGLQEVGMHTNDFSTFQLTMETTCTRGSDIYVMDTDLCDSGAIGASVVKECGSAAVGAAGAANEIQSADVGNASAGSFLLTYDGETTATVAFNASAATVLARLEALSNINVGDVNVTKTGTTFYVQFMGAKGGQDQPTIVADSTALTGGPVVVATVQAGG